MAGRPLPEVPETPGQLSTASPLGTTYYTMTGSSFRTANSSFRTSGSITPEIPRLRLPYTIRAMPSLDDIAEDEEDAYVGFSPGNKTNDSTLPIPQDDDDLGLGVTYVVASPDSTMTSESDSDKKQQPTTQEEDDTKARIYEQILHQASDALMLASDSETLGPDVKEIIDQLTAIRVRLDKGSRLSSSTSGISSGNSSLASLASKMIRKWERQTDDASPKVPPRYKNKSITVGPPGHTPAPQPVVYTRPALRGSVSDLSTQSEGSSPSMIRVTFGGFIENKETDKKETGARPKTHRQ